MKYLLLLLICSIAYTNEPIGPEGLSLGQVLGSNYAPSKNLTITMEQGTNQIKEIISTKPVQQLTSTLTYLTERYGTFNNASSNYEAPLQVYFKVLGNEVILVEANNDSLTVKYSRLYE